MTTTTKRGAAEEVAPPTGDITDEEALAAANAYLAVDERSVHERMVAILSELPAIGKDQHNTQQGFMYRGHDDVMNALNPLLAKHGVFVVPDVRKRVTAERSTSRGSTMYEVNLLVRYRFYGAKGDHVEASAWGEGTDMGDKSTSKAMTMAFKSVLAQAFAISTAELSDADATSPEETTRGMQRQAGAPRPRGRRDRGSFDPAVDVLQGAPKATDERQDLMRLIDPDVDWQLLVRQAGEHVYGDRESWDQPAKDGFVRRWSNMLGWVPQNGGDLWSDDLGLRGGAEGDAVLLKAVAWAFGGYVPETLPRVEGAPIPSGDVSHADGAGDAQAADESDTGATGEVVDDDRDDEPPGQSAVSDAP